MTLWGGRFNEPTNADLKALNDSIGFDKRMYAEDIQGSIAWARALVGAGVLTEAESQTIISGLEQVKAEFDNGTFVIQPSDEDIHTAVERRLTELVGEVGGKLHTGRSRNDQVAADLRVWTRDALNRLDEQLLTLQVALIEKAEEHLETVMPGYTHVQPAQPITAAHWLMSFYWMLSRDRQRLEMHYYNNFTYPLGSGALAGTPFEINRYEPMREFEFHTISQNSLDAVSDRDYVAEALFVFSLIGVHLSRLAEDIIWYSNPAFGFITLNDRYSTGSSLMPQKRNADPMELARGKTGRLIGHLTGFLTTLKGLPSTYNKDLQEDKEPLFDSFDTIEKLLPVVTAIIRTLKINPDKMRAALDEGMLATDLADYLVLKGMPFRQAHHVAGRAVRLAEERSTKLSALTLEDYEALSDLFAPDVYEVFDFDKSVARRNSDGGTAPEAVRIQINGAKAVLRRPGK